MFIKSGISGSLILLASLVFAEAPTIKITAFFTRAAERDAAYDYLVDKTTECYRQINLPYMITTELPPAYQMPFSSFTACYYLYLEARYPKLNEAKRDQIKETIKSNLTTWIGQGRIAWVEIKTHQCHNDEPPGMSTACEETVIYRR